LLEVWDRHWITLFTVFQAKIIYTSHFQPPRFTYIIPLCETIDTMKKYLYSDETLFRNGDLFEIDYVPEEFHFRESQMKDIALALRPALHGRRPLNIALRGLPGTGKTTAVKRIFAEVEETTPRLVPVYVNCQTDTTKYGIFSRIFAALSGHPAPLTGIPLRTLIGKVGRTMSERGVVVSVCLDDANYLLPNRVLNGVLFSILRLHQEFPGARAGVILPMSTMDVKLPQELDSGVLSVLQLREIFFPPYREEEIAAILGERVRRGLYPNVVSDALLGLIVGQTMRSGDLRVGLDLIRQSALLAERDGRTAIREDDVLAAYEVSRFVQLSASVRALTPPERSLLYVIADMAVGTGSYLSTGAVYDAAAEKMAMSYSSFYERLRKFDQMRLIELSHVAGNGRTREIALRWEPEKVREVCG